MLTYLDKNGPTLERKIHEDLGIGGFPRLARDLFDFAERVRFVWRGNSRDRRGRKAVDYFGDLHQIGYVWSLVDDPRLIEFVASHMPKRQLTIDDRRSMAQILGNKIGLKRAKKVIDKIQKW